MTKRIIYIVINLAIAIALLGFTFLGLDSPTLLPVFICAVLLILLLLIIFQIILLIAYGMKSKKNFDFLFVFSFQYSILLVVPYAMSVIAMYQVKQSMLEMQSLISEGMGNQAFDEVMNRSPFWGMHAFLLIPLGFQIIIILLRIRKNTTWFQAPTPEENPSEPNLL